MEPPPGRHVPEYLLRTTCPEREAWSLNPMPDTRAQAEVGGLALHDHGKGRGKGGSRPVTQALPQGPPAALGVLRACVSHAAKPSGWIGAVCSLGRPSPGSGINGEAPFLLSAPGEGRSIPKFC